MTLLSVGNVLKLQVIQFIDFGFVFKFYKFLNFFWLIMRVIDFPIESGAELCFAPV